MPGSAGSMPPARVGLRRGETHPSAAARVAREGASPQVAPACRQRDARAGRLADTGVLSDRAGQALASAQWTASQTALVAPQSAQASTSAATARPRAVSRNVGVDPAARRRSARPAATGCSAATARASGLGTGGRGDGRRRAGTGRAITSAPAGCPWAGRPGTRAAPRGFVTPNLLAGRAVARHSASSRARPTSGGSGVRASALRVDGTLGKPPQQTIGAIGR